MLQQKKGQQVALLMQQAQQLEQWYLLLHQHLCLQLFQRQYLLRLRVQQVLQVLLLVVALRRVALVRSAQQVPVVMLLQRVLQG